MNISKGLATFDTIYPFTPGIGWSASRASVFRTCKRKYYYQYYWKYAEDREKIKALRELRVLRMEIGSIVHELIAGVLEQSFRDRIIRRWPDIREQANALVAKCCAQQTFAEVYYGEVKSISPSDMVPRIEQSMRLFLESDRYRWILEQADPAHPNWLIESPRPFGESRLNVMKIFCKFDFLIAVDDQVIIFDWKTGHKHAKQHDTQLMAYSALAREALDVSVRHLETRLTYLCDIYQEDAFSPSEGDVDAAITGIREDVAAMNAVCCDPLKNLPFPMSHYELCGNATSCAECVFRELCLSKVKAP